METKLFNRNFLLLWLGQTVSQLGNGAGVIGLLWWVQTTTGSALALGTLAMIQTITSVALGPVAGAMVDRLNRKMIIVITDIIRGVNYCVLAWLAHTGQLTLSTVYVFAALNAVCGQLFNPAISSSIPLIVHDTRLEQANSLNQVSVSLVNIVGYAAGGVLVAIFGVPMLLFIDGVSFLLSAFSEMFITIPSVRKESKKLTARVVSADIRDGFNYIRQNSVLFRVMMVAMVLNVFSAPIFILLPKFVGEQLQAGSQVFGYLLSAQMAGALVATTLMASTKIVKNNLWIVRWGIVGLGVLTVGFAIAPSQVWWIHVFIFGAMGVINAIVNIYFGTVLQRVTRPEHMGKVFGFLTTLSHGLQPLSQGVSGILADLIRLPFIYATSGGVLAVGGIQFGLVPGIVEFLGGKARDKTPASPPVEARA